MEITLDAQLESALAETAQQRGVTPEAAAVEVLRQRLLPLPPLVPRDDWERAVLGVAKRCGVSLPPEAVTSEGIYD